MKSKKVIISVMVFSLLLLFITLGGVFADEVIETETTIQIDQSQQEVLKYLNQPENWLDWMWLNQDESIVTESTGKIQGEGAGVLWKSKTAGKGGLKLTKVEGDSAIFYELISDDQQFKEKGNIRLSSDGNKTDLVYQVQMDISGNIKARYISYLKDYGKEFAFYQNEMLKQLKQKIENGQE